MWSKLKRLLCYESQHQSQSNEKSLVQFDYEKAVSNYLGTQSTFSFTVAFKIYCFTSSRVCTHQSSFPPARLHCPHCCNTIARLLGSVRTFPTPLLYVIHHTILLMTISCLGQAPPRRLLYKGSQQGGTIKGNVLAPHSTGSDPFLVCTYDNCAKCQEPVECGAKTLPFIVPPC